MADSPVSPGKHRGGRPRLYATGQFIKAFSEVLPHLESGVISQNEAAKVMGISVRSLKRYLEKEGG